MYVSNDQVTGAFTFAAEGSDDPKSPYYYGRLSFPGGESGVTIGAGYDMRHRSAREISTDLIAAGVSGTLAASIAAGAQLHGTGAAKFVQNNSSLVISDMQALRALFAISYRQKAADAKACYDFHAKSFHKAMPTYGAKYANATFFDWESLYPSIRVIAIDFVYQGFGRQKEGYGRPLHFCMANEFDWLIQYIETTVGLSKYEKGRHRAAYLRSHKPEEVALYSRSDPFSVALPPMSSMYNP